MEVKKGTKNKKIIAILLVVANIILLSQLCFGSVSAVYETVTSLLPGDEEPEAICCVGHDMGQGEELQPMTAASSICSWGKGSVSWQYKDNQPVKDNNGNVIGYYNTQYFSGGGSTFIAWNASGQIISATNTCSMCVSGCSGGVCH